MTTSALRATSLTKLFRDQAGETVVAVDHLDLTVGAGDQRDDRGLWPDTASRPSSNGRVSAVMQTGGLLPDFTVRETVRAIAALHGRPERVEAVLERAGLGPLSDRLVQACSGGEQQRLKFALALVPDPGLVILDEPTTGTDVGARQQFWDAMRGDRRAHAPLSRHRPQLPVHSDRQDGASTRAEAARVARTNGWI